MHNHHKEKDKVLIRLSKAIGHLESVKRMVENDLDCSDILIQLSAVKSALNGVSKVILKDHIDSCLIEAVKNNDNVTIEALKNAIDKII